MAEVQAAPPVSQTAESGGVECDFCTERKFRAVTSCLVCQLCLCEGPILPPGQHAATEDYGTSGKGTAALQSRTCPQHDRPLEVFCHNDRKCICVLCAMEGHRGHNSVLATTARMEKQNQLLEWRRRLHGRIREREEVKQELTDAVISYKCRTKIFAELLESTETRWSEVKELIRAQQKAAVSRAEDVLKQLEQQIAGLRKEDAELEQLTDEEDDIYFLQTFLALQSSSVPTASPPSVTLSPHPSFDALMESLVAVKDGESCQMEEIFAKVGKIHIVLPQEPKTRDEFIEYSCQLTLDPNTAQRSLSLSEGNRKARREDERPRPEHPDRFDGWAQVLCAQPVSACRYWEVEWAHGEGFGVDIAVAYRSVGRKGGGLESRLGCNDRSWRLECDPGRCSFRHNNYRTEALALPCSRVGVYVDHRAGILSFYSVSDTMTLLHTVQTRFTEPLVPGFWVANGASVNICSL